MFNSQRPKLEDLPTTGQLLRATGLAIVAAGAILVTVVLPSEYAIDPTGIGRQLGLTQMGEIKAQLAEEAAQDAAAEAAGAAPAAVATASASAPKAAETGQRTDTMKLTLAPGQGAEIKATMANGAKLSFDWSVEAAGSISTRMAMRPASIITAMAKARRRRARKASSSRPSTASTAGSGAIVRPRR